MWKLTAASISTPANDNEHIQYPLHPATGTVVIATAAAVPEPAASSLMDVGFGLIICLLRAGVPVVAQRVGAEVS